MQRFLMFSISARLLSSSRPSQRSSLPSSLCSISFYLSAFCWTAQMWTPEKHICCVLLCVIPLFFSLCSYSFHRSPFPPLLCHLFVVFHFGSAVCFGVLFFVRLFILSLVEECRPRERRLTGSVFIFHPFSGRQRLIHVSVILSARGPSSQGQKMQAVEHLFSLLCRCFHYPPLWLVSPSLLVTLLCF